MSKKRVVIIVNKYWECDPVCNVLNNMYINDNSQYKIDIKTTSKMTNHTYPSYGPVKNDGPSKVLPRITFDAGELIIELWCISDLLYNSDKDKQSSSEEKMRLLHHIYEYDNNQPDTLELVVAVGTASSGPSLALNHVIGTTNINGSVVVGTNVFMHNGYDNSSTSNYGGDLKCWGKILKSGSTEFIESIFKKYTDQITDLFLNTRINPSPEGSKVYWDSRYIALGDVNVTDYTKYAEKDGETGDEFFKNYMGNVYGLSVETTHCLIYKAAEDYLKTQPPFVFVSGVVDRYLKFKDDVSAHDYAQNTVGAHNAGIVIAWIVSELVK